MSNIEETIKELSELPWPTLRKVAGTEYNIRVRTEHTKQDVLAEIRKKISDQGYVPVAKDSGPAPGYSRIVVAKAPDKSRAKIKNVNGYRCAIPRGVPVDVPTKVYLSITDEYELVREEDLSQPENSQERWKTVKAPKEAVTLLGQTPGPDPRPVHELVKERKNQKYRAFVKQHGYWPTDKELKHAIQHKLLDFSTPDAMTYAAEE